jgi:hypothetical protein
MSLRLFLLKRWDDFTYWYDSYNTSALKRVPEHKHELLSTKQLKSKFRESISAFLKSEGFIYRDEWDGELRWIRSQPDIGFAVVKIGITSKYAAEYFKVNIGVGFSVPVLECALDSICGLLVIGGQKQKPVFAGEPLTRRYAIEDRPKKRLPFPSKFAFYNVEFDQTIVQNIQNTIKDYALPVFDTFKSLDDLKSIGMILENRVVLLVHLNDEESAIKLLDENLSDQKRYGPEMKARLERLRTSIESGELQKAIEECSKPHYTL